MKILVISDTHRRVLYLNDVLKKVGPIDALIHLGDVEGQEDYICALADCPTYMVSGNNDFMSDLPREDVIELKGHRIFLTHGHYYRVSMTTSLVADEAQRRGCDIAMYGHTHCPSVRRDGPVTVINPGSLGYPRQENRRPSYILMEIDTRGECHYTINFL
ncbi:MAG: metallophosphoesterase [Lachnospiraceae bacterium]|nr:metallophosphoesterase [Lachnospiraceae bacterium]